MKTLNVKWVLPILFIFVLSCEEPEPEAYECKDCYFTEDNQEIKVFVCGETLDKFERDGYICIKSIKD